MNEMTTYRWSFEEDVAEYQAAGYPAIGVWRQKLSDYGDARGVELLAESGLKVSNLLWAGGFTGSDGRTFRESVEDAVEAIQLAASTCAGCLVLYTGARAGHTHRHARRLIVDALRELAPLAAESRVPLAIEPMHRGCAGEWTFLTSLDDACQLLDAVPSPYVQLALDTYHMGDDSAVLSRIEQFASRIAIVHLGDWKQPPEREQNRSLLGEGVLPLREIVAALNSAGYRGYFDVELMGEEIETADYRQILRQSREAYEAILSAAAV